MRMSERFSKCARTCKCVCKPEERADAPRISLSLSRRDLMARGCPAFLRGSSGGRKREKERKRGTFLFLLDSLKFLTKKRAFLLQNSKDNGSLAPKPKVSEDNP